MWANFEGRDGALHVMPVDGEGDMLAGHLPQSWCPCGPRVERQICSGRTLIIHDEPQHQPPVHLVPAGSLH